MVVLSFWLVKINRRFYVLLNFGLLLNLPHYIAMFTVWDSIIPYNVNNQTHDHIIVFIG